MVEDATDKFIDIMKREAARLEQNRADFVELFSESDLKYLIAHSSWTSWSRNRCSSADSLA
mgnify:CR=1 FL=1